jgi:hypothetical protein
MVLMWFDGAEALHVIDTATRFSSATFLATQSIDGVWNAFMKCWVALYVGYPKKLRDNSGAILVPPRWKESTDIAEIELQTSRIEIQNSLGLCERMHAPLR